MTSSLFFQALGKFSLGFMLVAGLLFLPAGSLAYWQGWLLLGLLFLPMFLGGLFLMVRCPDLLARRLQAREPQPDQQLVIRWSGLMFTMAFIMAGLNYRFGWWPVADRLVDAATGIFILSYLMYAEVLRENHYLSRTITVHPGQKVIDQGLYAWVRHPMYTATLGLFLSMGWVLASPLSFIILLAYLPLIIKRIKHEEAFLSQSLPGYRTYMAKVSYRLCPGIW